MDKLDALMVAALNFRAADRRYDEALDEFTRAIDEKKSDVPLPLVCKFAEASEAWDRADRALKKAAKKVRVYL